MNLKDTIEELTHTAAEMQLPDLGRLISDLRTDTGEEIHQVSNLDETENLVSLHFYLAPLESYSTYSLTSQEFENYTLGYSRKFSFGGGI
jgi:hypothetical protein